MADKFTAKEIANGQRFVGTPEEFEFVTSREENIDVVVAREPEQEK